MASSVMTTSTRPFPMTRLDSQSGSPPASTSPTGILTPCLSSKSSPRRNRSRAHSLSNQSAGHHGVRWADELPDVRLALVNVFVERDLEKEDWERLGLGAFDGSAGSEEGLEWWVGVAKRWRAMAIEERESKLKRAQAEEDDEAMPASTVETSTERVGPSVPTAATTSDAWPGRVIYHDEHESPTTPPLSLPSSPSSMTAEPTSALRPLQRSSSQHLSRTSPYSPMWAPPSLATRVPPPQGRSGATSRSGSGLSSLSSSPQSQQRMHLQSQCDERDLLDEAITRALSMYCRAGRYRRVSASQASEAVPRPRSFSRQRGHRRSISWDESSGAKPPTSSKPRYSLLSAMLKLASGGKPMGFVATDGSWIHPVDREYADGDHADDDIEAGEGEAGLAAKARDGILAALEWAIEWPVNVVEMLGAEDEAIVAPPVARQPRRKPIVRKATPAASLESLSGYASDDSLSTPSSSDDERLWEEDEVGEVVAGADRGSEQVTPVEEEKSFWRKRSVTDLVGYLSEKDEEASSKAKLVLNRRKRVNDGGSWSFTEVL